MKKLLSSFWFNVLLIIGVCFALYFAFFASLSRLTHHGESTSVPNLKGTDGIAAVKILRDAGFDVNVDSTYDPKIKGRTVIDIQPEGGSVVKTGRTIFLVLNKVNPPEIEMPNLVNLSFRSAQLMIESSKLILGDTLFKPDMASGAVLAQLVNGKPIAPGTKIFQGTKIDLVIGSGYGNKQINVPNVVGMTFAQAKSILDSNNLFVTEVWDGVITDSSTAIIYQQLPESRSAQGSPNSILEGENVDIRIRQQALLPEEIKMKK